MADIFITSSFFAQDTMRECKVMFCMHFPILLYCGKQRIRCAAAIILYALTLAQILQIVKHRIPPIVNIASNLKKDNQNGRSVFFGFR